jgi:signal peptidase II
MPYVIALVVVLVDQYTKALAAQRLKQDSIPVIRDVFHLTYVKNTGAAFGILKDSNTLFIIMTSIILIGLVVALIALRPQSLLLKISTGLVVGGALGNLIDRICLGFVIDFFDFRIINYPVFNIADSCVVVGAILICTYILFFDRKKGSENAKI